MKASDRLPRRAPTRFCTECSQPLTCRQPGRHWTCAPECPGCHRPVVVHGGRRENCTCTATAAARAAAS